MRGFLTRALFVGLAFWAVEARGALTLTKTPSAASVSAGDVASFVYGVHATTTSSSVTLVDTLPAGVTWSENSASCTMTSGRDLSCSFGTLAAGASRSVTVTGTTDFADCGTLSSTATVVGTTGGDQATAGVDVLCPDVTGFVYPDSVGVGQPLAYTLSARNDGAGIARSVQVKHTYVNGGLTWSLEPPDPLCSIGPIFVTCTIGDLAPGAGHTSRIVSNVTTNSDCGLEEPELDVIVSNAPVPYCCSTQALTSHFVKPGDASGNCVADVGDVFYLINFLVAGGPDPVLP
jgi:hypothetical protein